MTEQNDPLAPLRGHGTYNCDTPWRHVWSADDEVTFGVPNNALGQAIAAALNRALSVGATIQRLQARVAALEAAGQGLLGCLYEQVPDLAEGDPADVPDAVAVWEVVHAAHELAASGGEGGE